MKTKNIALFHIMIFPKKTEQAKITKRSLGKAEGVLFRCYLFSLDGEMLSSDVVAL